MRECAFRSNIYAKFRLHARHSNVIIRRKFLYFKGVFLSKKYFFLGRSASYLHTNAQYIILYIFHYYYVSLTRTQCNRSYNMSITTGMLLIIITRRVGAYFLIKKCARVYLLAIIYLSYRFLSVKYNG